MLRQRLVLAAIVLAGLGVGMAQTLPDPFMGDTPQPPAPTSGNAGQQKLPPPPDPTAAGATLKPYPLQDVTLTFPQQATPASYAPLPTLGTKLASAAARPQPKPAPKPAPAPQPVAQPPTPAPNPASSSSTSTPTTSTPSATPSGSDQSAAPAKLPPLTLPSAPALQSAQLLQQSNLPQATVVAIATGARPAALVEVGKKVVLLRIGDTLPGSNYTVTDIAPRAVTVSQDGRAATLHLEN